MAGLAAAAILSASPEGGNAAHAFLAPGAPGLFTREAGSGLNSAAAAGRRATCASRACSGLKAQVGDGEANTLEEYKRRLKEVDALEGAPRAKRQAPDEGGGGLFGKLFAKKAKGCQTDYDCNEGGRNWPLRCVDVIFTKVCCSPAPLCARSLPPSSRPSRKLTRPRVSYLVLGGECGRNRPLRYVEVMSTNLSTSPPEANRGSACANSSGGTFENACPTRGNGSTKSSTWSASQGWWMLRREEALLSLEWPVGSYALP